MYQIKNGAKSTPRKMHATTTGPYKSLDKSQHKISNEDFLTIREETDPKSGTVEASPY